MPNLEDALMGAAFDHDVLKVREDAGPNKDKAGRIAQYLKACGIHAPAPWCAAFIAYHLVVKGGFERGRLPNSAASTCAWMHWATVLGILNDDPAVAKRGDAFVWCDKKSWQGHMGFIIEAKKVGGFWWVRSLEGNSNYTGSRNGDRIVRRGTPGKPAPWGWRRWTSKMKVIRLTEWAKGQ